MFRFIGISIFASIFLFLTSCSFFQGKNSDTLKGVEKKSSQFILEQAGEEELLDEDAIRLIEDEEELLAERATEEDALGLDDSDGTKGEAGHNENEVNSKDDLLAEQTEGELDLDSKLEDSAGEENLNADKESAPKVKQELSEGDLLNSSKDELAESEPETLDEQVLRAEGGQVQDDIYSQSDDFKTSDTNVEVANDFVDIEPASKKRWVSVKKIRFQPYTKNGVLVNAVYLVRPGDNLASISEKIYGTKSKVTELKKVNPHFSRKKVKIGDKVYYGSALRPEDNQSLLTYYEERNLQPSVYVVKGNQNIRKLSKKLLGHAQSWKEVWATNSRIESKGELSDGTEVHYWPKDIESIAESTTEVHKPEIVTSTNEAEPIEEVSVAVKKEVNLDNNAAEQAPPSNPEAEANFDNDVVATDLPEATPSPPSESVAVGNTNSEGQNLNAENNSAEVASSEVLPPLPLDTKGSKPASITSIQAILSNKDMLMSILVSAVGLLLGGMLWLVIRRKKQRAGAVFAVNETTSFDEDFASQPTEITRTRN